MPSYVLKRNIGRTNCLTYVPKNVNLTYNAGVFTVHAGSIITVPYGGGTALNVGDTIGTIFEVVKVVGSYIQLKLLTDFSDTFGGDTSTLFMLTLGFTTNGNMYWSGTAVSHNTSGSTDSKASNSDGALWYDNTNHIIYRRYGDGTVGYQYGGGKNGVWISLPIAIHYGAPTKAEQIFDWCGFIGSHQFFLPGIKGLKSNGFNADGTYKNIEVETKSVLLNEYTYQATNQQVFIAKNGTSGWRTSKYYSQETEPALTTHSFWHNTNDNFNYYISADTSTGWVKSSKLDFLAISSISTNSSYQVTSLIPATVRITPTIKDYVLKRRKIIPEKIQDWTQPIATANTTAIEGGDMVITSTSDDTGSTVNYAWYAMDNTFSGNRFWEVKAVPSWWQVKFPYKLKITGLKYYKANNDANNTTSVAFYTSSAMTTQIGTTTSTGGSAWQGFDISGIPTAGIITDTIYVRLLNSTSNYTSIGELQITAKKVIPKHVEDTNYVLRRK